MSLVKLNARSATALDATVLTGNLPSISGASLTGIDAGINMMDAWYQTSTQTHSSGTSIFTAWSRMSNESAKKATNIGSAMTQSSGTFTFPSTGKYFIMFKTYADGSGNTHYAGVRVRNADNETINSSYSNREAASNAHNVAMVYTFMDIDDVTNNKCKIYFESHQGATSTWASGGNMETSAIFMRIGDT
tara:strand:+ start:158 stop:727 length:570 start_codon:yes stop_codon:yes gene_type:complete